MTEISNPRTDVKDSTKTPAYASEVNQNNTADAVPNPTGIFSRANLLMMAGCLALIIIGFALMSGGSSSVEGGFNPDIFSTRRIVVGPALAFLGFLLMAFAIIYTPRKKDNK